MRIKQNLLSALGLAASLVMPSVLSADVDENSVQDAALASPLDN